MPRTTGVWPLRNPTSGQPRTAPSGGVPPQTGSRKGPVPRREQLHSASPPKDTVATVADAGNALAWPPYRLLEGRKGPFVADLAAVRVIGMCEGLPGPKVWLVLRRQVVESRAVAELKYYLGGACIPT